MKKPLALGDADALRLAFLPELNADGSCDCIVVNALALVRPEIPNGTLVLDVVRAQTWARTFITFIEVTAACERLHGSWAAIGVSWAAVLEALTDAVRSQRMDGFTFGNVEIPMQTAVAAGTCKDVTVITRWGRVVITPDQQAGVLDQMSAQLAMFERAQGALRSGVVIR